MSKRMDVLVDLQFGSTGKGALAGYIGVTQDYVAVISCNMPNAGHTAYSPEGEKFVHKVLPSAIFGAGLVFIGVGPGAVFSIERLAQEWRGVRNYRSDVTLVIHEAAGILLPSHAEIERATLSGISSTMQGSAEALISKIRRQPGAIVRHNEFAIHQALDGFGPVHIATQAEWVEAMGNVDGGEGSILLEGSQGYSLGLSSGFYPFCTSRDCTPARVIADCSLPVSWLRDTYASCRVHPIRVGNTPDGYSGDWYPDQEEITFEDLGVESERTTVTNRVRRIATFSSLQIAEAMAMAMPSDVFLNFCNYDGLAAEAAQQSINDIARRLGCGGVSLLGHGPRPTDITEVA